jgi:electron-transferring-flavoprotein dehydrogenase
MGDERETLEIDVLFVGAGPASLAGAYHLARLLHDHNEAARRGSAGSAGEDGSAGQLAGAPAMLRGLGASEGVGAPGALGELGSPAKGERPAPLELSIGVLEKGHEIGSHAISGAVVDPRAFAELFPEDWQSAPFEAPVGKEEILFLTGRRSFALPVIPPPLRNHGSYVASLGKLLKWMAPRVEAAGVDIFYEFPATEALIEDGRVVGVRTGDRGVGRHGEKKANYEPGIDIRSRCVVLGEGPRGTLVKQLDRTHDLWKDRNPPLYAIGIKEIWDLPRGTVTAGQVLHTLNWPLGFHNFGGGFVYGMQNDQLIVGLVVGLDYENPLFDPHLEFQRFKTHPAVARLLAGGKMSFYGAKAIPEGGWWSLPRLGGDGFLLIGDSAGFLNSERLKGIHLAMKSGMLAAEAIFEELSASAPPIPPVPAKRAGASAPASATASAAARPPLVERYTAKIESSWVREELWPVRNFHQAFDHGFPAAMLQAGVGLVTGGRGWGLFDRLRTRAGHERMVPLTSDAGRRLHRAPPLPSAKELAALAAGTQLVFDRLGDVFMSGTTHEEDQPVHLHVADPSICATRCTAEYANPCERFCPAAVYELVAEPAAAGGRRLQINASNCVHCKTCDIMDPYGIIDWVPPEGGGGPNYGKM